MRTHGESTAATRNSGRPPTNSGRKTNGSGGSPTPPWLWLLLLGGFALIFWQFVPKNEVPVLYYPWFYEQVAVGQYQEHHDRRATRSGASCASRSDYENPATKNKQTGREIHHLCSPTEQSLDARRSRSIIRINEKKADEPSSRDGQEVGGRKKRRDVVKIDPIPANSASSLAWILFLLPTFVVLVFFYLMMRRARDQFDGGILGSFVKSPGQTA